MKTPNRTSRWSAQPCERARGHRCLAISSAFILLGLYSSCSGSEPDKNCSDFSCQGEAQDWHEDHPDDGLDGDGDGIACEHLPACANGGGRSPLSDIELNEVSQIGFESQVILKQEDGELIREVRVKLSDSDSRTVELKGGQLSVDGQPMMLTDDSRYVANLPSTESGDSNYLLTTTLACGREVTEKIDSAPKRFLFVAAGLIEDNPLILGNSEIPEGVVRRVRVTVEGFAAKGGAFREHRYYGLNSAVLVVPACDLLSATGAPVHKIEVRVVETSSPKAHPTFLSGLHETVRVATTSIDLSTRGLGDATGLYIEAF